MNALIGTAKGLVLYDVTGKPRHAGTFFAGFNVNMVYTDPRNGRWWVGVNHKHWGSKLHFSDDKGSTWHSAALPKFGDHTLPNGNKAKLRQIWCMAAGGTDQPDVLWMGTDPGGLFKSENGGRSFELVETLWYHPSRKDEMQWFGAGSDYPFIHTIIVDPFQSDHVYIAVSCAGIFETTDGGSTWHPRNEGLVAAYLPNPRAEVGHDPHMVRMAQQNPAVMWQQNHCGVFYSLNGGGNWVDVSRKETLPYYGFALTMDQEIPSKAWVIPVESDEQRMAPNLMLQVMKTEDFGKTWADDSRGLPQEEVFDIVLRHAFERKQTKMIFGTTNGNVFYRPDDEATWEMVTHHLTKINSIVFE